MSQDRKAREFALAIRSAASLPRTTSMIKIAKGLQGCEFEKLAKELQAIISESNAEGFKLPIGIHFMQEMASTLAASAAHCDDLMRQFCLEMEAQHNANPSNPKDPSK